MTGSKKEERYVPGVADAIVPRRKVTDYLLSRTHRAGKGKAAFFLRFGFSVTRWEELAEDLRRHARENAVVETGETAFGTRYVVDGPMRAPDGAVLRVRSVWFVERGETQLRFVTAHPLERRG